MDFEVTRWANDFLDTLRTMQRAHRAARTRPLRDGPLAELKSRYGQAQNRLLLLDYDGTLVQFVARPELAAPPAEVVEVVARLAQQPGNKVVLISGRDSQTLDGWFGHLPVDMVAEHGSYLKQEGIWRHDVLDDGTWKELVRPFLQEFAGRCPGAFVEEKSHSLAWHYRSARDETGFRRSRELILTLHHFLPEKLRVLDGNKVVEIKSTETDKGKVARQLTLTAPYDFVLALGDDRTDEDMFAALTLDEHQTVKVGRGNTAARFRVGGVGEVLELLQSLADYIQKNQ